uniref:Zinc finger CCHC domain-containing protein 17 n=1 Tax=Erpetoichthys calabaricus TaxID=27687 RepID=A0A8C4T7M6_ERPCA
MDELPDLFAIIKGEVASITEYGAFVKIPGCRKQGLVHKSHMSSCRVDRPSEIVDVGEKVWVKVIGKEVKDEKVKLSLSMKVVNQGTGKDLDPNNVVLEQDERKRKEFRDDSKQKITLEAVLNTVCKKCGCKGHFANDCFSQPGGMKYSLVPDDEEEEEEQQQQQTSNLERKPAKKHKEKKKKKQKRKSKSPAADAKRSDSSDSEDEGQMPAKRHSYAKPEGNIKKHKHKKHKHKSHKNH